MFSATVTTLIITITIGPNLSVHGDAFKVKVRLSQHGASWRLVDTSRFDAYKTVLHNVDATHSIGTCGYESQAMIT